MRRGAYAVMVTGSDIPENRNGLKFDRPAGEITKTAEAAILAVLEEGAPGEGQTSTPATPETDAIARYQQRYAAAFAPDILQGLRIAVYQQSSVARDLMADLLTGFGAEVMPIGRSQVFVPIDTGAHRPEDIAFIRDVMASGSFNALVTTDGDADRPLVADGAGRILRGDVLGLITARFLGADTVVVPVTAGSALEHSGGFRKVVRTKVGSPFVIAGMEQAMSAGARIVAGFEANGGFLLGSDVTLHGRTLAALPTRDAMLPILATLAAVRAAGTSLADLVSSLDAGEMTSDRHPTHRPRRAPFSSIAFGIRTSALPSSARSNHWPRSISRTGSGSSWTAGERSISGPQEMRPSCAAIRRPRRHRRRRISSGGDLPPPRPRCRQKPEPSRSLGAVPNITRGWGQLKAH